MSIQAPISAAAPRIESAERKLGWLVMGVGAFLCVAFGLYLTRSWNTYVHLNPTAGVWMTAAIDASRGILYRPIESDIGYGGTRYAPLHIVLHAGLIRLGMGPIRSGYFLDLAALLMVMGGLFQLMRQLNVEWTMAVGMSTFVLSAYCFATTGAGIKGDLLPAAFNLWGLAAVVFWEKSQRHHSGALLIIGAILFVLAEATKLTSIFGIGAAVLWLIFGGRWRPAILLGVLWVIGVTAVALATQWASGGRALAIFRLCASGGGGWHDLLRGPRNMLKIVIHRDRAFGGFCLIAAGIIVIGRKWKSLPAILLIVTTLGTVAILGSPGTNSNHFVDLAAAAVLVIGTGLNPGGWNVAARLAAAAVACYGGIHCLRDLPGNYDDRSRMQMIAALAASHKNPQSGILLSENPLLPILEGETPYMLDSFMFRTICMRHPEVGTRFWDNLSQRRFRAVILDGAPELPSRSTTNSSDFGPTFIARLQENYVLESQHGEFYVYFPRPR